VLVMALFSKVWRGQWRFWGATWRFWGACSGAGLVAIGVFAANGSGLNDFEKMWLVSVVALLALDGVVLRVVQRRARRAARNERPTSPGEMRTMTAREPLQVGDC
jgi:hypothetical protein